MWMPPPMGAQPLGFAPPLPYAVFPWQAFMLLDDSP